MTERWTPASYHYRILEQWGEGLNSRVYKALREDVHGHLSQPVALKILKSEKLVDLWRREFETLSRIKSPFCVSVLGWEWVERRPALVLEFVEGITLQSLARSYSLTEEEIEDISGQILAGLKDLHYEGLCHGDLSPSNILVDVQGRVRLVDFGLANNREGERFLTPAYASPEVLGGEGASFYADLFALGRIRREIIGKRPGLNPNFCHQQELLLSPAIQRRAEVRFKAKPAVRPHLGQKVLYILMDRGERKTQRLMGPITSTLPRLKALATLMITSLFILLHAGQWPHAQVPLIRSVALLTVRSHQWVRIWLNGKDLGYAPFERTLSAGHYLLEWQGPQGKARQALTLAPGQHIFLQDSDFTAPQGISRSRHGVPENRKVKR